MWSLRRAARAASFTTLILFLLFWAQAGHANDNVQVEIASLISENRTEEAARRLLAADITPLQRLYLAGLLFKRTGQYEKAIEAFRSALRHDPSNQNVQQELAHTLYLNKQFRAAKRAFTALVIADPNGAFTQKYAGYLAAIEREKPVGISGYFSITPSTNINGGTGNIIFDTLLGPFVINTGNQAQSGLGISAGIAGYFRRNVGENSRLTLTWGLDGESYPQAHSLDWLAFSTGISYAVEQGRFQWSVTPNIRWTRRANNTFERAAGVRFNASYQMSETQVLDFEASQNYLYYPSQAYRSGQQGGISLQYSRQLADSLVISFGGKLSYGRPQAEHLQYNGYLLTVNARKNWDNGVHISAEVFFGEQRFLADFPLAGRPRQDSTYGLTVSFQNDNFSYRGFTPRLSCTYSRNTSNIALYDSSKTECGAIITKRF